MIDNLHNPTTTQLNIIKLFILCLDSHRLMDLGLRLWRLRSLALTKPNLTNLSLTWMIANLHNPTPNHNFTDLALHLVSKLWPADGSWTPALKTLAPASVPASISAHWWPLVIESESRVKSPLSEKFHEFNKTGWQQSSVPANHGNWNEDSRLECSLAVS